MTHPDLTTIDRAPIDELVDAFAEQRHCPSIAWGVVHAGALALHGANGQVGGSRPDARTVYRIASMTKSFSAAITLLLRDEGALRLDDPIGTHAPELAHLRSPTDDAPPITVLDLLCMSSGLVTDDAWADRHLDLPDDEFDRIVAAGPVFAHPTGACHEYSNFGFALLGRVVHRATGTRLRDHVERRLLGPLGMDDTTWDRPDHDRWARPMAWAGDRFAEELPTPADGMIAPMGGLWTTVADLATWVAWLADAFPARDGRDDGPLSRASRREMQTAQRYVGARTVRGLRCATAYGYGLRVFDEPAGTVITHSGGLPGYGSNMRWVPGGSVGVVALANVTYAPMGELAARIHDELREQGAGRPSDHPVPPVVRELGELLVDVLDRWATGATVDAEALAAVFTDNVGPDDEFDDRTATVRAHGPFTVTELRATSDAAGRIAATTRHGEVATITFHLAPLRPPRIQDYDVHVGT